jgi:hypothetical protein
MSFPINFQISTEEQLKILINALQEFCVLPPDEETQWQAECLQVRLETFLEKFPLPKREPVN